MCYDNKIDRVIYWTLLPCLLILACNGSYCIWSNYLTKLKLEKFVHLHYLTTYPKIMICISIITIVISITAFFSAMVESYPFLMLHAYAFLLLSTVMIVSSMIVQFEIKINKTYSESVILKTLRDMEFIMDRSQWFNMENSTLGTLEREFKCCGIYSWQDYWAPIRKISKLVERWPLPRSCCDKTIANVCIIRMKTHRQDGCIHHFVFYFAHHLIKTTHTTCVFGTSAFMDAAFLFILARKAKEYYYFYPYYV